MLLLLCIGRRKLAHNSFFASFALSFLIPGRGLKVTSPSHLAGLRDVPIRQPCAYPRPCDFELRFAVLQIDARSAIAAERWLAVCSDSHTSRVTQR